MLVTLEADPVLSLTLPGKVQTYMAAGKPIIGSINGETAEVIKKAGCGFCGQADNLEEFISILERFESSKDVRGLCFNARSYYEKYFAKDQFAQKLESFLNNNKNGD